MLVLYLGYTQSNLSQIPLRCINPQTLYLNAVDTNFGVGDESCSCETVDPSFSYCQIVNIELSDNDLLDYSCFGLLLNGDNPYGSEIKVYSSITCEEYLPIYPDLPNRYFIQVSDAIPGSSIQVVICKSDESDLIVNADTTPSGLCERNECQISIECPEDKTIKPQTDCEYILDDYRNDIVISDNCEILYADYIVEQLPPPRSILYRDTVVSLYLYNESGPNRVLIDICDFKINLLSDTISPELSIDTSVQKQYLCQYDLPSIESISFSNSSGQVVMAVDEYVVDNCNGFSTTYRWTATDDCGNSTEFLQRFEVLANFNKPVFTTLTEELKVQAISNCRYVGKLPVATAVDNCGESVNVIAKLYDASFNYIGLVDKEIEITDQRAFVIYEAEDNCGNLSHDTISVQSDGFIAPELECVSELNYVLSPLTSCGVSANWSLPAVVDNCSGVSIKQLEGPKPGDLLTAGNYLVSYEARDNAGNTSVCSFSINVKEEFVENFACVDINYSVDQSCRYDLLVEAVFEYNNLACTNLYSLNLYNSNGLLIPAEQFKDYIGQTVEYELCYKKDQYCCSAQVKIEDKLIPKIECQDITISCLDTLDSYYPTVLNECKEVKWEQSIIKTEKPCDNDSIEKIIYKQWVAVDIADNRSEPCVQKIFIKRLNISKAKQEGSLVGPKDTTLSCSLIDTYNSGVLELIGPTYKGNVISHNNQDCNLYSFYEDQILLNIDCNMKILRRWSISEPNCYSSSETVSFVQFISFKDTTAPTIRLDRNNLTLSTNDQSCKVDFVLPEAVILDNCSSEAKFNLSINHKPELRPGDILSLEYGLNTILYSAEDHCGNMGFDTLSVTVIDKSPPVSICLNKTSISLSNGSGWLSAEYFDEGSYDECSNRLLFEVRKMTASCNDTETLFSDKVSFCCSEIGQEVPIIVRAIDQDGNWNECMTLVSVVDKNIPLIQCPSDITIDCSNSIFIEDSLSRAINLGKIATSIESREQMGIASSGLIESNLELLDGFIDDSCPNGYHVIERTIDQRNKCGTGLFTRIFELADGSGSIVNQCQQVITIIANESEIESSIIWPDSETVVYGCDTNLDSMLTGPITSFEQCALLGVSFDDKIFNPSDSTEAEEICFKVLRKWEVIDWCNNTDSTINKWQFDQLIKVLKDSTSQVVNNSIIGTISDFSNQPIVDAKISLGSNDEIYTDNKGTFKIDNIESQEASLSISLEDNPVDEISALDAFMLQRYLLTNSTLNTTPELIAADINMDQKIDPLDLSELTKLILGVVEDFSHNKTWRFIPEELEIRDAAQLTQIEEELSISLLDATSYVNFKGVKIGDIHNNSNKQLKSNTLKTIELDEMTLHAGQVVELVLPIDLNEFMGLEYSHNSDVVQIEINGIQESYSATEDHLTRTISYATKDSEQPFRMNIMPKRDILLSSLLNDKNIDVKTYESTIGQSRIKFVVSESQVGTIELSSNTPNPFSLSTQISVISEKNTSAIIGITNLQGQIIMQSDVVIHKGINNFDISKDILPGSGIYIYFIRTDQHYDSGRMVFIND